jgi:hypothetical protein
MFRQFGSRVIVGGRRVRDDYWESWARKQGFTEEDPAAEKRPGASRARKDSGPGFQAMQPPPLPPCTMVQPPTTNVAGNHRFGGPESEIMNKPFGFVNNTPSQLADILQQNPYPYQKNSMSSLSSSSRLSLSQSHAYLGPYGAYQQHNSQHFWGGPPQPQQSPVLYYSHSMGQMPIIDESY